MCNLFFKKPFAFVFCAVFLAGCATATKDRYQEITVNSNVSGAIIEIDGVEIGYTPFRGLIKRGKEGRIKVGKPGYISGDIQIEKKRDYKTLTGGNAVSGLASGSPYIIAGIYEHSTAYPNRKSEYDERSSRGETGISESSPSNNSWFMYILGFAASTEVFTIGTLIDGFTSSAWEYSPSQFYVQLIEEGQSGLDYYNELAIRHFATVNHSQIAIDAGETQGEYVNALANLMESKMKGDIAKQSINEALEKSKGDQVMFGDALILLFSHIEE